MKEKEGNGPPRNMISQGNCTKHFFHLPYFSAVDDHILKKDDLEMKGTRQEFSFFSVLSSLSVTGFLVLVEHMIFKKQSKTRGFSLFLLCSASEEEDSVQAYARELEL